MLVYRSVPSKPSLLSRWCSFSGLVGYVSVPWRVTSLEFDQNKTPHIHIPYTPIFPWHLQFGKSERHPSQPLCRAMFVHLEDGKLIWQHAFSIPCIWTSSPSQENEIQSLSSSPPNKMNMPVWKTTSYIDLYIYIISQKHIGRIWSNFDLEKTPKQPRRIVYRIAFVCGLLMFVSRKNTLLKNNMQW